MVDPDQLKRCLDHEMSTRSSFALSGGFAIGDQQPFVMTQGATEKGGTHPVAQNARWHIGSITKSFTATLIMRLVERGVLDLDAAIERYLPDHCDGMHADWRSHTLRQLLSHTAGLPPNPSRAVLKRAEPDDPHIGREQVLSEMWIKRAAKRGAFRYSNTGYILAGFVVETVTGRGWEDLIQSEIAAPLGLASLGFGAPLGADDPLGHFGLFIFRWPIPARSKKADNPRWLGPAGTLHLSMPDLLRWGRAHLEAAQGKRPEFLSQSSAVTMKTPVDQDYGLGWINQPLKSGSRMIWHNGSNTMWYATLAILPEQDVVCAAVTNRFAPRRPERLVRRLVSQC